MSKRMPLTQGKFAIVDDEDFRLLSQWKWYAHKRLRTHYAVRTEIVSGKKSMIYMHRFILGACSTEEIDHKDNNGLNNQRKNIRKCTRSQNNQNTRIRKASTSGYKGVNFYKRTKRYRATISINKKSIHLGYFNNPKDAAICYDTAAKKNFGEFAKTNF